MSAEQQFIGKWNLVQSENFDGYLKHIGVGMVLRTLAKTLKPVLDIRVENGHWKITSTSTFKTQTIEFDLDKEIDDVTADGRKVKSTFSFDGTKLTQVEKATDPKGKDSKFVRYINSAGQLVIEIESNGVKATRTYEKAK